MELVGYGDRWSAQPEETIRFMVSAVVPRYHARLVRLIHGDTNPAGPGYKDSPVPASLEGWHDGREQPFHAGSFAVVPGSDVLAAGDGLTLAVWVFPTTPGERPQALLAKWDGETKAGYALVIDEEGAPALWLGDGNGGVVAVTTGEPLRAFAWHRVETSFDATNGRVRLSQRSAGPPHLPSGVYAVHLQAGEAEDHIPFFVRPRRGTATAPIAVLLPTYTYLAYANEQITWRNPDSPAAHDPVTHLMPQDHYVIAHRLKSAYDHHADDSGVCFSSRLRPVLNMRPNYRMALILAPLHFPADLYLIDWLEAMGHRYDVLTDEDLHAEGAALLHPYRVVITGSHHEYWSGAMLDAVESYLAGGGRWMSLSGNADYWPIGIDTARPHLLEIRRGNNGTGTWRSAPGEAWFQVTGEPGSLWRDRGRAPQRLVGVGMSASGFDVALPFHRLPASHHPRADFIFAGVGDDEPIGDTGLMMGGAAGLEIGRADAGLGTPPHALVVATARGYSNSYLRAIEEVTAPDAHQGGEESPAVRGDMAFFETPNNGAVFSVGSITWFGSLSANNYDNPVSLITGNVPRAFSSETWPERPRSCP